MQRLPVFSWHWLVCHQASDFSKLEAFDEKHRVVTGAPSASIYDSSQAGECQKVNMAFYVEDLQTIPGLNSSVADLHQMFM